MIRERTDIVNESCGNCKYFYEGKSTSFCRRHPPTVQAILISSPNCGSEWSTKTMFPTRNKNGWCGEWEAVEAKDIPEDAYPPEALTYDPRIDRYDFGGVYVSGCFLRNLAEQFPEGEVFSVEREGRSLTIRKGKP